MLEDQKNSKELRDDFKNLTFETKVLLSRIWHYKIQFGGFEKLLKFKDDLPNFYKNLINLYSDLKSNTFTYMSLNTKSKSKMSCIILNIFLLIRLLLRNYGFQEFESMVIAIHRLELIEAFSSSKLPIAIASMIVLEY